VYSQEAPLIGVLPNKKWCTPQQVYKSSGVDNAQYRLQNRLIAGRREWCTPQQEMVYSPTRNGVLPNKKWCTPQQEMVYSPTRNGVLPNKSRNVFFLQIFALQVVRTGFPVLFMLCLLVLLNNRKRMGLGWGQGDHDEVTFREIFAGQGRV
jgi:hypothetical protein